MHVADFTLRLKDQSGTANRDNRRVYNEENRTQLEELDAVPRLGDDGQRVANALRLADAAPRPAMPPVMKLRVESKTGVENPFLAK